MILNNGDKMKLKIGLFCLFLISSVGCRKSEKILTYDDFVRITIEDINEISLEKFYLYFYLPSCPFCHEIRDEVFFFASKHNNFYFVDCSSLSFPISEEDTFIIYGTPTIIVMENLISSSYIGVRRIRDFLEIEG